MLSARMDPDDYAELKAILRGLGPAANRITVRTINKTLTGVRTDATNEIYKKLNLTKKRIREDFAPPQKAYGSNLKGVLKCSGKPIGLYSYGAKQLKSGYVSVKVLRAGSKKKIRHAFIAKAKNATNVFWRQTIYKKPVKPGFNYAKLPRAYRFPIERLTGPRIEDIYADPPVLREVLKLGWKRYDKELARLLQIELNKYK